MRTNRKGRPELAKLPADGDPMFERVARIRERDYLLVDTYHDQYLTFYDEVETSYIEWRSYSYEEEVALAKATFLCEDRILDPVESQVERELFAGRQG